MKIIKNSMIYTAMLLLSFPIIAQAHVKWFTEEVTQRAKLGDILSTPFIISAVVSAVVLLILPALIDYLDKLDWAQTAEEMLDRCRSYSTYILQYGVAIGLALQILYRSVLVPELDVNSNVLYWVMGATILVLLIPKAIFRKIAAALLLYLFVYQLWTAGALHMLDYGFYVAIALAFLVENTAWERYKYSILYVGIGLSLCWVSLEKWIFPGMGLNILENYPVPTFGFTPETFLMLTGFIEFAVGFLFLIGVLNRVLAIVVTLLFILTTMIFGTDELVGHFIVHILMIVFIIEGTRRSPMPISGFRTVGQKTVFMLLSFLPFLAILFSLYYNLA